MDRGSDIKADEGEWDKIVVMLSTACGFGLGTGGYIGALDYTPWTIAERCLKAANVLEKEEREREEGVS